MSAPFRMDEDNKMKMAPKDDSSDSNDNIYINFDGDGKPRNISRESDDPRNSNKIRSVNNLRYTDETLKTSETLAEESGILRSKQEKKNYI